MKLSNQEQKTLNYYEDNAKEWSSVRWDEEYWVKEFEQFRNYLPKGHILDVGCGHGREAGLFFFHGYRYFGIDFSKSLLRIAKSKHPKVNFLQMDMCNMEFPSGYFNGFWAPASLLHIPKRKIDKTLSEIRRVVVPGGIGFIAMKKGNGEKMVYDENGERFFSFYFGSEFEKILQRNGFEILSFEEDERDYNPPESKDIWLLYFVKSNLNI